MRNSIEKTLPVPTPEYLICPNCSEKLAPVDVEAFGRCPYCDYRFREDARFEDFVLSPAITRWVNIVHQRFPRF